MPTAIKTCLICSKAFKRSSRVGERDWKIRKYCGRNCYAQSIRTRARSISDALDGGYVQGTGCWNWKGPYLVTGLPYGVVYAESKPMLAHRAAWTVFRGPIPKGICVLHRCDNPKCVNPQHLFLGTRADNIADMIRKGRDRKVVQEQHWKAKLTRERVVVIRTSTVPSVVLARQYGVCRSTINSVRRNETWKGV